MTFWTAKRITVTGGAGFLGSFVVERMRDLKAIVSVPRSSKYDLTQPEQARRMYRDSEPDVLVHLAALVGGIGANRANPGSFFYDNMAMGLNVLEEGRRYGSLKKMVVIGTTCSYPKFTSVPFRETDLWSGFPEETNAPYGVAKRALLTMAASYQQQYGMNIIYLVPTNLYGPRDNFDPSSSHVIPAIIRKFVEAREGGESHVVAWGSGNPTREFLYVEDAAEGIVLSTERYEKPDPVNLGTGQEISIRELVHLIARLLSYKGEVRWDSTKPDGQPRRCLDTSRAESEFGFRAHMPLEEGLKRTIRWFLSESPDWPHGQELEATGT